MTEIDFFFMYVDHKNAVVGGIKNKPSARIIAQKPGILFSALQHSYIVTETSYFEQKTCKLRGGK